MEIAKHEKIPETHVLVTLLAGNAWLFNAKKKEFLHIRYQQVISQYLDFWRCVTHRSNGKFTLNLCDAQVFKTKNSKVCC